MKDEKYVSIEYDRWVGYYKPLEEINKRLEQELANKEIIIKVTENWGFGHYVDRRLGWLNFSSGTYKLEYFDKDLFVSIIESQAKIKLTKTQDELDNEREIIAAVQKVAQWPAIVRWFLGIKK